MGRGGGGGAIDPADFFVGGYAGFAWDFTRADKRFTTSAGSTPAVADGDPIGRIEDISGNGKNGTQGTALNRPVLSSNTGFVHAYFDGQAQSLVTPVIDFSASSKITVVAGVEKGRDSDLGMMIELSTNISNGAGRFYISAPNTPPLMHYGFAVRGASDLGGVIASTFRAPHRGVVTNVFDLLGATLNDRVRPQVDGTTPTIAGISGASGGGGTVFASDQAAYIGARAGSSLYARVGLSKLLVIGKELSAQEMAQARRWASVPASPAKTMVVVGDSTVAGYLGQFDIGHYMTDIGSNMIASPGQTIAQQRVRWNAIASYANFDAVVVQIGLNDMNPAEDAPTAIARLQTLVDDINADISAPIVLCQMTPAQQRWIDLYGGVNGPIAQQKWVDFNAAIAGTGPNAITGVDARVTSHIALLDDGSGNLAAAYDTGDHIHENNAGRSVIAAAWRAALVSVGVLT